MTAEHTKMLSGFKERVYLWMFA